MDVKGPKARMVSIEEIIHRQERFLIPLYQRLYVWTPEQVERLMDDILAAWQQHKPVYYLGGILALRPTDKQSERKELELIDGQQRLTTLWLLAIAWRNRDGSKPLDEFVQVEDEPRIRFAIREKVNDFLHKKLKLESEPENSEETAAMEKALEVLKGYPGSRAEAGSKPPSPDNLPEYIRQNVKMALTEVPQNTDLNKLFEVINNRGEQLQHHDILKQRLLQCIKDGTEAAAYARLWEACAAMDGYVERNLPKAQGQSVKYAFEKWYSFAEPAKLGETKELLAHIQQQSHQGSSKPLSLNDILAAEGSAKDEGECSNSPEEEDATIQSILPFPLLLQQTLRIFRHLRGQPDIDHIYDKDLLKIFNSYFFPLGENEDTAKSFIRLLWEVRAAFDSYVVKWVERDEGERRLDVRRIEKDSSYGRTADGVPRGLSLLQAVIYHSQSKTTQYWLTPFLYFALANPSWNEALVYLEYLDHVLFTKPSEENLRELSHEMLSEKAFKRAVSVELPPDLSQGHGTDTRHYWFYKTEYVIWKAPDRPISVPHEWRIVARNSVEHIDPQQAIEGKDEVRGWLHKFANLALVSREDNSSYGNDILEQKRKKFENSSKHTRSLKLELVFRNLGETVETIEKHRKELEQFWTDYLSRLAKLTTERTMDRR